MKLGGVNSSINIAGSQSDFPYSHVLTNKISLSNLIVALLILKFDNAKTPVPRKTTAQEGGFFQLGRGQGLADFAPLSHPKED